MKLNVGERLEGAGPEQQPGGYVVTSVVRETPWDGLYLGKKIFYNFDFTAKRVRETDDVEWLDVYLRTIRYPILDDPNYVQQRRALARTEARAILGNRQSNLWPEPLDLLEVENVRDPFAFADSPTRTVEPVLVFTRPYGRFTPEWQRQILPIASILSVLAELLEFLKQAHSEGLLLLGLGPAALLIDASDRVHYIGTEMVLGQQSIYLKEATAPAVWQRLFPGERFARGYSAPECFDPTKRPDVRADLYAWGSLAYGLITGTDLGKIAHEQGRPWTTFVEAQWRQLEKVLTQLPAHSMHGWAEQIGVDARALQEAWPHKFLTVFRMLLSPDPARRPRSVAELLAWLADPPPSPVADFLALYTEADTAKLLLDCTGVETDLEIAIQCGRNAVPRQPTDGVNVAQGPLRAVVGLTNLPLTVEPVHYTVFTRRKKDDRYVYSPGVSTQLWYVDPGSLRQWVEQEAAGAFDGQEAPTQVGMVLGALDLDMAVESLRASTSPRVRAWGWRLVEQALRLPGRSASLEPLLWRFVADPSGELRQSAAATLWTQHPTKTDEVLLRLVEALEAPPLDAPIPLTHFLRQLQLPEERIRRVAQQVEAKRPTECPFCKKTLTLAERGPHLQSEHGYVLFEGDLAPADVVSARLWERVLHQQDHQAHEALADMYLNSESLQKNQDAGVERYLRDLQRLVLGGTKTSNGSAVPVALPYSAILAYQNMLRLSKWFVPIARQLLQSPQRRLCELGCQTVLPYCREQLQEHGSVEELRRLLRQFCPARNQTDLQIDLCRQLSQLGADETIIGTCIVQVQEERLVGCSECRAEVQAKHLEFHLRRAHQIFQFRGERRSYQETRDAIVKAVCSESPDVAAWHSLQSLAEDKYGKESDRHLVGWLFQHIKDADTEQRGAMVKHLAELLVTVEASERLLPIMLGPNKNASWEALGQRLALEICVRLPPPIPALMIPLIMPFLDQKEMPRRTRENAVLALLRSVDKSSPAAMDMLRAYVAQTGKERSMEKLQHLEQRFGQTPAIELLYKEIEDEIRMSCSRCATELRKKDMVGHLWDMHRLVLDGQRVREPWRVIEDWVVDYGLEKDPRVLERCRELALKDDPNQGLARLQRLLYRHGLRDRELLNELRTQVRKNKATLCPHCCGLVPIDDPPVMQPITLDSSCLEGYGYRLAVSESGLAPSLEIESPEAIVYRGYEPGSGLTRIGGILFTSGLFVAGTYGAFDLATDRAYPVTLEWTMALGVGLCVAGTLYMIWPSPRPVKERLVKAAWKLLVPEMLQEEMNRRSWGFLHGLVKVTDEVDVQAPAHHLLLECCEQASAAARTEPLACACLATLSRHYVADLLKRKEDPFEFILTLAKECFTGKLPLAVLQDLAANFQGKARSAWSKSDLNRLTIFLADQAFAAEVDIDDWLNLGRAFPVLNDVINLEQRWHWLQFQALWRQRRERPWKKHGEALTMLELAETPADYDELLAYYPDVLLYVEKANLVIGTKGVWIEGVCVTDYAAGTEVSVQRVSGGHELIVGYLRIRCSENPQQHLDEIQGWLGYYFQEFVPSVPSSTRLMTESRHRMWQLSKTTCPECARPLAPCLGDLGVALR